ncbi:hypothetical protein NLO98_07720 [Pseudomonas syringae]|nr:hypothetical protein [Pseudomonas syringae]
MSSLTAKAYSVRAVGLYGSNPESAVRSFTIIAGVTPVITRVQDSIGEIALDCTTAETTVILTGTATANQRVEILDGVTSKGEAPVGINGAWTFNLNGLTIKSYSITAKGIYAGNPVSLSRTFSVAALGQDDLEGQQPRDLPFNVNVQLRHGLIAYFSPTNQPVPCSIHELIPGFLPSFGLREMFVYRRSHVRFEFGRVVTNFKVDCRYVNGSNSTLTLYGVDGEVVGRRTLPPYGSNPDGVSTLRMRVARLVSYCILIALEEDGDSGFFLDNFEWY